MRIRWEEEFGEFASEHEWLGCLGKVIICKIDWGNALFFFPMDHGYIEYSKLSSAKRGAERLLDRFLEDAGLEVKG